MIEDQDNSSDVIESYTKINGISIKCIDVCIEMKNEYDRLMDGSFVPYGTTSRAAIRCDGIDDHINDLLSNHHLFNVVHKTFYRNGNIIRIELKDAYYNKCLSNDGKIVFELLHSNDDNTTVVFY